MGHTNDLLAGLGQLLATAGIVNLAGSGPSGVYVDRQTGFGTSNLPDQPDRFVCLTDYPVGDSPNQPLATIGVQVRTRAGDDPDEERDLRDAVYQTLQGRTNLDFGSCHVIQIRRISTAPLGKDASGRWSYAQAYYIDVNTPTTPFRNQ
jgi:hypothetical protein